MKYFLILLLIFGFFAVDVTAGEIITGPDNREEYTQEIDGTTYDYSEEGEYQGYEQKVGDKEYMYEDDGTLRGEAIGDEEHRFMDKE